MTKSSGFVGLVVAVDANNGIGKDNALPWKLTGDMKFFKELTIGHGNNAVIMGRKTWESIPNRFKPLPNRCNIVLSRTATSDGDNVRFMTSLPEALQYCRSQAGKLFENVFIIGGSAIYGEALTLNVCDYLFITKIKSTFDCDTFFPAVEGHDDAKYREISEAERDLLIPWAQPYLRSESGIDYEFVVAERSQSGDL